MWPPVSPFVAPGRPSTSDVAPRLAAIGVKVEALVHLARRTSAFQRPTLPKWNAVPTSTGAPGAAPAERRCRRRRAALREAKDLLLQLAKHLKHQGIKARGASAFIPSSLMRHPERDCDEYGDFVFSPKSSKQMTDCRVCLWLPLKGGQTTATVALALLLLRTQKSDQ